MVRTDDGRHDWSPVEPTPGAKYIVQARLFRIEDHDSLELVEVSVPVHADDDLDAFTKSGEVLAAQLRKAGLAIEAAGDDT